MFISRIPQSIKQVKTNVHDIRFTPDGADIFTSTVEQAAYQSKYKYPALPLSKLKSIEHSLQISIDLKPVIFILAPSGAGKSTLISGVKNYLSENYNHQYMIFDGDSIGYRNVEGLWIISPQICNSFCSTEVPLLTGGISTNIQQLLPFLMQSLIYLCPLISAEELFSRIKQREKTSKQQIKKGLTVKDCEETLIWYSATHEFVQNNMHYELWDDNVHDNISKLLSLFAAMVDDYVAK